MILLLSADRDLTGPLAEHIRRELGIECTQSEDIEKAKDYTLIVSDRAVAGCKAPVIAVEKGRQIALRRLLENIRATAKTPADEAINFNGYRFSPRQKQLSYGRKNVDLTDKEAELLSLILGAGKKGVDREMLLKKIWGLAPDMNTHTLETHIYRLRAKFRDISGREAIEAEGGGYRMGAS